MGRCAGSPAERGRPRPSPWWRGSESTRSSKSCCSLGPRCRRARQCGGKHEGAAQASRFLMVPLPLADLDGEPTISSGSTPPSRHQRTWPQRVRYATRLSPEAQHAQPPAQSTLSKLPRRGCPRTVRHRRSASLPVVDDDRDLPVHPVGTRAVLVRRVGDELPGRPAVVGQCESIRRRRGQ